MEMYLLKSGACLAILFVFYKFMLENENMHLFKRFYLLGMLVLSFGIPLLTFTTYIEIEASEKINQVLTTTFSNEITEEPFSILEYLPTLLWTIYGLGVVFFSFRFGKNLVEILGRITKNEKVRVSEFINVLLQEPVIPHTFFSYVFLNKQKFEADEIPSEVILHEQTHAKQKHSFDVLFIELLQIVCWFNPFIYFIKDSIKLNHEFLADRAVLSRGIDASNYQNILLAFSSNAHTPQMANAINYSSSRLIGNSFKQVKKRFTVMKTHTSRSRIWTRSLLLLPLLAVLIYSFSTEKLVSVNKNDTLIKDFYLKIDSEENIYYNDKLISLDEIPNAINSYKETYPNEDLYFAKIDFDNQETSENLHPLAEIIKENGIEKLTTCWVKIKSEDIIIEIEKDKTFTANGISTTIKDLGSVLNDFNQNLTKEQRSVFVDVIIKSEDSVPIGFITDIQEILINYGINRVLIPGSLYNDVSYNGATKSQLAEYNKLAKKYNNQDKENRVVLMKDLERLEYIYNLMTDKQKATAEPFPDCFPPPPPTPEMPYAPIVSLKPIDHIIRMAKNNAAFLYETERISSDKAIALIKENDQLNIETEYFKNSNPIVKITKEGLHTSNVNIPPTPYKPIPVKDPIKTIEKLSKEGTRFLFFDGGPHPKNGIEITKDRAIETLKVFKDVTVNITNNDYLYKTVEIRLKGC